MYNDQFYLYNVCVWYQVNKLITSVIQDNVTFSIIKISIQASTSSHRMSIESRYDTILKDMITLLQEALCRFLTQKEVDVHKFKQYFAQFYKSMQGFEESFHEKSAKFSKNLSKLAQLLQKNSSSSKFSLQPTPAKLVEASQMLSKPKTISHSNYASLNIIGEQQQLHFDKDRQRRSGTAEGRRRSQNFVIDFSQGKFRPKTGVSRGGGKRYKNQDNAMGENFNSQTISQEPDLNYFKTLNSRELEGRQVQYSRDRKSFYDQLQKQNQKAQMLYQNLVKIPKKRSISTHRWSFKINKLF